MADLVELLADSLDKAVKSGRTLYSIAKIARLKPDLLYRFSRGDRNLRLCTAAKLASALELTLVPLSALPPCDETGSHLQKSNLCQSMEEKHVFERGLTYTRREIFQQVGGNLQSYLPHVAGRITAACLRPDLNPDPPAVILAGTGERIERSAKMVASQCTAVPTFLRRNTNQWEYVGDYIVERWSENRGDLEQQAQRSRRTDVTQIIYMTPAHTQNG